MVESKTKMDTAVPLTVTLADETCKVVKRVVICIFGATIIEFIVHNG